MDRRKRNRAEQIQAERYVNVIEYLKIDPNGFIYYADLIRNPCFEINKPLFNQLNEMVASGRIESEKCFLDSWRAKDFYLMNRYYHLSIELQKIGFVAIFGDDFENVLIKLKMEQLNITD